MSAKPFHTEKLGSDLVVKAPGVVVCVLSTWALTAATAEAAPCTVDSAPFENLKIVQVPSHTLRRASLGEVRSLPPEGRSVTLDCAIPRSTGKPICAPVNSGTPVDCYAQHPGGGYVVKGASDPIVADALWAVSGYRFDLGATPGDKPIRTRIVFTYRPDDLLPFEAPASVTPLPMESVVWLAKSVQYAARDQELGFEGHVTVDCQVQSNGRLLCADVMGAPRPTAFSSAPVQLEDSWRAAPALADGTPSTGRWVRIGLTFTLRSPQPALPQAPHG